MTRTSAQKARYLIDKTTTDDTMYNLIDRIYDDIDKKICSNCIHLQPGYPEPVLDCTLLSIKYLHTMDDFGCNKFEPK